MNALRRIHQALVRNGVVLDLQPKLANAPVLGAEGVVLGRLDETEFRAYADKVNRALEETISAGLFAVVHLQPIAMPPIFLLGLVFAYLYQRTESIWPAVIMHVATNTLGLAAAYLLSQMEPLV